MAPMGSSFLGLPMTQPDAIDDVGFQRQRQRWATIRGGVFLDSTSSSERKERVMVHSVLWRLALTAWLLIAISTAEAATKSVGSHSELLSEDRVLLGTVEEVRSEQARIQYR